MNLTMVVQRIDWIAACLALALPVLIGCGSDGLPDMVPIKGEVTYKGKPLAEGQVVYLPKAPGVGRQASGSLQSDGTFVLTTQVGGDGAMYGEYDIVVFGYGTDPGKEYSSREEAESFLTKSGRRSGIPEKYSQQGSSGLSDTVDKEHSGFKRIELGD
jgi:hypothetical protein